MMRRRRPIVIEILARGRGPEAMRRRRGPVEILISGRGRPPIIVGLCACPGRRKDKQGGAGEKCAHVVSRHAGPQGARDHMNERRALRFSRRGGSSELSAHGPLACRTETHANPWPIAVIGEERAAPRLVRRLDCQDRFDLQLVPALEPLDGIGRQARQLSNIPDADAEAAPGHATTYGGDFRFHVSIFRVSVVTR